ncbi:hypothetical protein, partial [Candidatus Liberibacter asiaticus]|uniref:hypothetical protein n=1 Tax=Liberibacter asiaticus TaxID=34021 RepID=UPI001AEFF470
SLWTERTTKRFMSILIKSIEKIIMPIRFKRSPVMGSGGGCLYLRPSPTNKSVRAGASEDERTFY